MATQCRGTKTKRINRHKLAVIQAYIIIGTLVLIGFIGGLVVGRATAPKKQVTVKRLMPTHAEVLCKIPSTALCETIYTVNKDRLGDFVRTCTDKEMEGVNAGILCSLGIAAPVVDGEPVDNSVTVERNLYKHLYEDLLNKVMAR